MKYTTYYTTFFIALILAVSSVFLQPDVASAEECLAIDNPCCVEQYDVIDLEDRVRCTSGGTDACEACCDDDVED
jgi:hypothetical protein